MKRLLYFLLLIPGMACSQGQKISDMPTYIGNPNGGWTPVVIAGVNRKVDAAYFGFRKVDSASVTFGGIYDTTYYWKAGTKAFYTLTRASGGAGSSAWSGITGTPTTLAGYGITDAAALSHTHAFSTLTSKPTTLSGYGITDAAASSHVHAATDITSGTMASARLGSGSASSTTYLRGDGTWATPAGGPGGTLYGTTGSNTDGAMTQAASTTALGTKAATSHTHAGTDINSGIVAAARLGSGTANAGTVLRGDNTWGTDSANTPIGPTLDYSNGFLNVGPGAGAGLFKSVTIATQTYTVAAAINQVFATFVGGTITITLPSASANVDREITITNLSTNSLTVTPVYTGSANTFVTNNSGTFHSNGTDWILTKHS